MRYRVVLIFADTYNLAAFVEHIEVPGEVSTQEYSFVGNLTEEQIKAARLYFGAYVRVLRELE